MLFNILPYVLVLAICVKIPMTRRLIKKYPIISKIGLMLLKFIKDLEIKGMYSSPNHLTGFSADTSNNRRDAERSTSPSYFYLPYNIYYDHNK